MNELINPQQQYCPESQDQRGSVMLLKAAIAAPNEHAPRMHVKVHHAKGTSNGDSRPADRC